MPPAESRPDRIRAMEPAAPAASSATSAVTDAPAVAAERPLALPVRHPRGGLVRVPRRLPLAPLRRAARPVPQGRVRPEQRADRRPDERDGRRLRADAHLRRVARRPHRRARALLIGTVITGVCIGAVALAPSYGTMLLLLGASGLGCGFIYPTAVKAIMLWFPPRERATAVGVNQSAVNVSGMIGAAIMPWLAVAYGWQAGFVFAAGLAFVVCVVAVLFYRDPRPDSGPAEAAAPLPVSEIDQGLPAVTGDEADRPGGAEVRVRRGAPLARHLDDGPRGALSRHGRVRRPGAARAVPELRLGLQRRRRLRACWRSPSSPAPSASR